MKGSMYGTMATFQAHHRARRARTVRVHIAQAQLSAEAQGKLRDLLGKDLRDLGIQEEEVFCRQTGSTLRTLLRAAPVLILVGIVFWGGDSGNTEALS